MRSTGRRRLAQDQRRRHPEDTPRIHQADRGGITGGIDTLALAPEVRATFAAWQQALGLHDVAEDHADQGGKVTWLRARADRGGVRVSVQAHVFTEDPAAETEKRPVQRKAPQSVPARSYDLRPPEPVRRTDRAPEGPRL